MEVRQTRRGVKMTLPGTPDVNHIDGIGTIFLVAHLPLQEALDLRNADLTIRLRGEGVDLKGGRLAWVIVSNVPSSHPGLPWQQTNWAFVGKTLDGYLDGEVHTVTTRLVNDPAL